MKDGTNLRRTACWFSRIQADRPGAKANQPLTVATRHRPASLDSEQYGDFFRKSQLENVADQKIQRDRRVGMVSHGCVAGA